VLKSVRRDTRTPRRVPRRFRRCSARATAEAAGGQSLLGATNRQGRSPSEGPHLLHLVHSAFK
jgi:hypothetical protein